MTSEPGLAAAAVVVCAPLAAAVLDAPLSTAVADAAPGAIAAAVVVVVVAAGELAPLGDVLADAVAVAAPEAGFAPGALAADTPAAAGMPVLPVGIAEKLLDGKGGRDGAPVDVFLPAAGWRGGICDSRVMLTLVLFAAA